MSISVAGCRLTAGTDLGSGNSACVQLGRDDEEEGKSRIWRIEMNSSLSRSPYCGDKIDHAKSDLRKTHMPETGRCAAS